MPNNKTKPPKKKIALALQGGGAHGAFTWGVLDKLLESELFEIEGISGTSAGGMNAVALIQGMMENGIEGARDTLGSFWNEISELNYLSPYQMSFMDHINKEYNFSSSPVYHVMSMMQSFLSPYQSNPLDLNLLRNLVDKFFNFEKLSKYKAIKLFLCATHIKSGKLRIFNLHDISLNVMLASSCLPSLFKAIEIDGEHYWDGGFVGNPAIYPLIYECKTKDLVVIQLTPTHRNELPFTSQEIMDRHKEITYNACLMREMRSIILITDMINKGIIKDDKVKKLNMHLIKNEEVFQKLDITSAFNTSRQFLFELYNKGYKTAADWIKENYDKIGVQSTAELKKDFSDF
jgi:NTE family protein